MISLSLPWVPPSLNNAYVNTRGGGRALSEEGRRFKTETPAHLIRHYREQMMFFVDKQDVPLTMAVRFTLTTVENAGWNPSSKAKKKVSRYKKLDASNRLKLLEDALAEAAGVDDAQNLIVAVQKVQGPQERTDIWVWDPGKEDSPFDRIFAGLRSPSPV